MWMIKSTYVSGSHSGETYLIGKNGHVFYTSDYIPDSVKFKSKKSAENKASKMDYIDDRALETIEF